MPKQCNQESFRFHPLSRRQARGRFTGGAITSDAGALLLREVEKRIKEQLRLFTDRPITFVVRTVG